MEFYNDVFKKLRKHNKLSMALVAEKLGITRKTLGVWESGQRTPSEIKIRLLAQALNVRADEISDLQPGYPASQKQFSDVIESWISLSDITDKQIQEQENDLINKIKKQQRELRQANIVIKSLLGSMHSIFYVKDKNLKYITANHAFHESLSLSTTYKVLGKTDEDFYPVSEAKQNHEEDYNVLLTGKPILKAEGCIPGTRKKQWALISKIPIFDTDGKIAGLTGSFLDITDRKKAQSIRELLEANVNYMTEALTVTDVVNKKYLFMNKAKEKLFGYSSETFFKYGPGYWMDNCIHPDDREEQLKYRETNSWPKVRSYRILKPNGELRWVETRYAFPDKKIMGKDCALTLSIDITERKKIDDIIKLLELAISDTHSITWLLTPELRIIYVSESVEKLGLNHKQMMNSQMKFNDILTEESKGEFKNILLNSAHEKLRFSLNAKNQNGKINTLISRTVILPKSNYIGLITRLERKHLSDKKK
ncbi:MAG TPA: PAS domain-containing protein [Victivallales bacterium]|nr:PAS domain-containing protein [Victivallales bacterium]